MSVACLYLKHFPAWSFVRAYRVGRPVVVTSGGRVLACTQPARRKGIEPGMAAGRVRTLLPEARIYTRDRQLEAAAWEEVLHELNALTPFLEDAGPGLAFLSGFDRQALGTLANRLGAQVGIAAFRCTARLAGIRAEPRSVLDVPSLPIFLDRFPVRLLADAGFEEDLIEQLRLFGYTNLGAITKLSRRHLKAQFGAEGERLYTILHPAEEPPVAIFQPPPAIYQSYDFEQPVREPGELIPVLEYLGRRTAEGLASSLYARRLTIRIRPHNERATRLASRILPEAARDPRRFLQVARTLLLELLDPTLEIDELVLELGALQHGTPEQGSLFFTRPTIYQAVRAVHRRYPGTIVRAVTIDHTLLHEQEVRFEPFPEAEPGRAQKRKSRKHKVHEAL